MRKVLWEVHRRPEIEVLVTRDPVVIIPTGSVEQHGPHLPLNTDINDASEIARRVAEEAEEPVVVAPPVWSGYSPHHMRFPGTISLSLETFSGLILDICRSIHAHGFRRLLLLNGHGGNGEILRALAVKLAEGGILPAVVSYWELIREELKEICESGPGGLSHACEMETSLQLFLQPELVQVAEAQREINRPLTSFFPVDFRYPAPVFYPYQGRTTRTGVWGDPTVGTREKGARIVEAAVKRLKQFVGEFRRLPLPPAMRERAG